MRTPSCGYRQPMRVNMTPMIDVIFLLIIFFLVSSHLARQESQLPLPLPSADSGEKVESERERIVINVLQDGTMLLSGRRVNLQELTRRLRNEAAEQSGSQLEVRIRGDRTVAFQFVQPILLGVSQAGIGIVTFAVTERGG